jgi:hypothetical protein
MKRLLPRFRTRNFTRSEGLPPKDLVSLDSNSTFTSHGETLHSLLASLLDDDNVVARLAQFVHFEDMVNLSRTSKAIRASTLQLLGDRRQRADRLDLMMESVCIPGDKRPCWACQKMVCSVSNSWRGLTSPPEQTRTKWATTDITHFQACKDNRQEGVIIPHSSRIEPHARSCTALCSQCFNGANLEATKSAPIKSHLKPHDLSVQHVKGCTYWQQHDKQKVSSLCSSCGDIYSTDGALALVRIREQREEKALQRTVAVRNLPCFFCHRPLGSDKKRRWICMNERLKHECNWAGHDIFL